MKVVFYAHSLMRSGGGVRFAVIGLARALEVHGVSVTVVGGAGAGFASERDDWDGVIVRPHSGGYGLHAHVLRHLWTDKPDLVHVHGIWSATSIYGRLATAIGLPTIVSPHGMLAPLDIARRPVAKRLHGGLVERPLLVRAHVHALNQAELDDVRAFMPAAADRAFVVPNGVTEVRHPVGSGAKKGTLFLGRLHPVKQAVELVSAWRSLRLPPDERLTVAGSGDTAYETTVRQAAGDAANVDFVGPLHGEAKSAALSRARFFVLPSLREGLPMTVLEAIQHGCIPIITAECGLPELFEAGVGLRMESDFGDFASVMARAHGLCDDELAQRSAKASELARGYAWPRIARQMIGHYETFVAAGRGGQFAA